MITMRILIVQNVWEKEGFASGGVWDEENFGLKAKKTCHKRTPQKCPKGPPEGKLGESASHHLCKKERCVSGGNFDGENFEPAVNRQPGNRGKGS